MFQQLTVSMKFFQLFLSERFVKHRHEGTEALLMLVVGNLMGFYNPNQLADYLGLDKNALYRHLRSWSLYQFKRMLSIAGCHCALTPIRETLSKSASTQSRNRVTVSVDDTVVLGVVNAFPISTHGGVDNTIKSLMDRISWQSRLALELVSCLCRFDQSVSKDEETPPSPNS